MNVLDDIITRFDLLPEAERVALLKEAHILTKDFVWLPNPGPQTDAFHCLADELFYGGEAGGGKALANQELIITPFGFRPIGSLRVGDTICAADGTPTKVIGVYPQGIRPLYRVTFQDGVSVLADADHRWNYSIAGKAWGKSRRDWKVGTTSQIASLIATGARPLIPLCKPLKFTKAYKTPQRIIEPYVLGLLLGDGYTKQTGPGAKWSFASNDPEIIAALPGDWVHDGGPNYRIRGPIRKFLQGEFARMGLAGCGSQTKFIPEPYKWAAPSDRLALLQGLMDTDGTIDDRGHASYCSISIRLAEDVAWLVRSLGGRATIAQKPTTNELAYTVYIRTAQSADLFRLRRKWERGTAYQHGKPKRRIVSVEYESDGAATCIAVDHPESLYVVGAGCVVTHNTDLLLGTALSSHRRSLILRRLNGEVAGLYERLEQILGHKKGFSASPQPIWRFPGRQIRFGGVQYLDDRKKYQGTPNDLLGFDEISNFLEAQYRFIIAWARSTFPGQRARTIATGNPPTNAEGQWVTVYWGPWLDKNHPNPAVDGELRWFTTVGEKDHEVLDVELDEHGRPGPVVIDGVPLLDKKGKPIYPRSRTFIRAELSDNPDLEETGYGASLMALPAVLRAAMGEGDFTASQVDDAFQVIPTDWIEKAQARWSEDGRRSTMNVLGVDIAQGGDDNFVIAPRHGMWFDHLKVTPGREVPDGPTGAGLVFMAMRDSCEVILDMGGGHGGSVKDHLKQVFSPTLYLGAESADGMRDRSGIMKFYNVRAASTWFLRDALDPDYGSFIALPPDPLLKADLAAYKWHWSGGKVLIAPKDEMKVLLGRSPDRGDAVIMAHFAKGKTSGTRSGIGTLQTRVTTSGRNPRPGR